jgi:hypothetical protein
VGLVARSVGGGNGCASETNYNGRVKRAVHNAITYSHGDRYEYRRAPTFGSIGRSRHYYLPLPLPLCFIVFFLAYFFARARRNRAPELVREEERKREKATHCDAQGGARRGKEGQGGEQRELR